MIEQAKKALHAAGYDTHTLLLGFGLYVADVAPDSSEYDDGTEPGGDWDTECDAILASVCALVEPHGCTAEWSDDDIIIFEVAS